MNKKILIHHLTIMLCILMILNACLSDTTVTNIKVNIATPTRAIKGTDELSISNCDGNTELIQTLGSATTIQTTITIEKTATSTDGSEYLAPETLKLQLEIEVDNAYQAIYTNAVSRLEDVKLSAIPGYQTVYTIQWEQMNYSEKIAFSNNNMIYEVPYRYELISPNLIYQEKTTCPGNTNTTTKTSEPTLSPEALPEFTLTTHILILITNTQLYKGPSQAYGAVSPENRLVGEEFSVILRSEDGNDYWFLVQASDGTQGWLYFQWVKINFDKKIIPVASLKDIPSLPPTPTKRPSDSPTPTRKPSYP